MESDNETDDGACLNNDYSLSLRKNPSYPFREQVCGQGIPLQSRVPRKCENETLRANSLNIQNLGVEPQFTVIIGDDGKGKVKLNDANPSHMLRD